MPARIENDRIFLGNFVDSSDVYKKEDSITIHTPSESFIQSNATGILKGFESLEKIAVAAQSSAKGMKAAFTN